MPGEGAEQKIWYCNTGSGQCQNLSPGDISSGRFSGWNRVGNYSQKEAWTTQWNTQHPVEEEEPTTQEDIIAGGEDVAEEVVTGLLPDIVETGGETAAITQPGLLDYWESLYGETEEIMAPSLDEEGNPVLDEAGNPVMEGTGEYQLVEGGDPGWLQQQIDYATGQAGLQADLLPLQLEALGYRYNDAGELEKIPLSSYEQALEDRRLAGMGYKDVDGELVELTPEELDEMVSPGLQSEIDKQTTLMEERLSRKGITPGSTGYSQAMSQLGEKVTSLKQQERQGWLTGAQGLLGAETARLMASTQTQLGNIGGLGTNVAAPPMPFSSYQGLLGTAAAGMQPYQYQQGLEYGILPTTMNLAAEGQGMSPFQSGLAYGVPAFIASGGNPAVGGGGFAYGYLTA